MNAVNRLKYKNPSREELFSGLSSDFPYIKRHSELDRYFNRLVPWHWHKEIELFYIENGILEYYIPNGKLVFPKGSGGFVNSNVLHMTQPGATNTIQSLHIFDTILLGGHPGSRIEKKYILPITDATQLEILLLTPDNPKEAGILAEIKESFQLSQEDPAYELKLRESLSRIWYHILEFSEPVLSEEKRYEKKREKTRDKLKAMMIYIHENYREKLSISEIATAAFISERECFRVFQNNLNMTPLEYLRNYRMQEACHMLIETSDSITSIGQACGIGDNSYFSKLFRTYVGCTPQKYRLNGGIVI